MLTLMARGGFAACLLLLFQSPSVRFDSARNAFLLENWAGAAQAPADRWSEILFVSVDSLGVTDVPPLLGSYRVDGGALVFTPRYPLQAGMSYRAVGRVPGAAAVVSVVTLPKRDATPTTLVERIYPSANVLPENQLKFYIHFSAPMSRGFAFEHVALLDEFGAKVDVPFLELGEELWDPAGRRFTLFFDPGRIKRGLVSQQELGIALHEGKRYSLRVDKGWKDAEGRTLAAEFRKDFLVGPPDRKTVDLQTWSVRPPGSGSRAPLTVVFPEPMDHAIVQREIDVVDAAGNVIEGGVALDAGETSWIFTPDAAWRRGSYKLRVGTALADLAGNMIERPFEIDVFERVDQDLRRSTRTLDFRID